MVSQDAEDIVYRLMRQGRVGHKIIREKDIQPKQMPNKIFKKVLKELLAEGFLIKKKGLGTFTYAINPHKKEAKEIYERKSQW
jgi:hypothetical protein